MVDKAREIDGTGSIDDDNSVVEVIGDVVDKVGAAVSELFRDKSVLSSNTRQCVSMLTSNVVLSALSMAIAETNTTTFPA